MISTNGTSNNLTSNDQGKVNVDDEQKYQPQHQDECLVQYQQVSSMKHLQNKLPLINNQQTHQNEHLHDQPTTANVNDFNKNLEINSATTNQPVKLSGQLVDNQTRCSHYHSPLDIIAIKFKCCNTYYPCYQCHSHNHSSTVRWNKSDLFEHSELVILCGCCYHELTFQEYTSNNNLCLYCHEHFNPGCSLHYDLYFDI